MYEQSLLAREEKKFTNLVILMYINDYNIITSMFHLTSDLGCLNLATFWKKNYLEMKKAF